MGCAVALYFTPPKIEPNTTTIPLSDQEQGRRATLLAQLRNEYILSHDGISPALAAGLGNPPADWANERLRELGEGWQVQKEKAVAELEVKASKPKTLLELFKTEFPNTARYELGVEFELANGQKVSIRAQRYVDISSRVKFIGFYIPDQPVTYDICIYLADGYKETLQHMDSTLKIGGKVIGESGLTKPEDLIFSGRIYSYYEAYLSPQQIGALTALYEAKG